MLIRLNTPKSLAHEILIAPPLQNFKVLHSAQDLSSQRQYWGWIRSESLIATLEIEISPNTACLDSLSFQTEKPTACQVQEILALLLQELNLKRLEAHCDRETRLLFEELSWASLPLNAEETLWKVFWINAKRVIQADFDWGPLPIQKLELPEFQKASKEVFVLRTDLNHPLLSGNKWFKLAENLRFALANEIDSIGSFGGAWSNHLFSLAAAGHLFGFETVAMVRGEAPLNPNPVLKSCLRWGMKIHWLDRSSYRQKHHPDFLAQLKQDWPNTFWIPEGGSNLKGVRGCKTILNHLPASFDVIVSPVGTGSTLAGLIAAAPPTSQVIGIPVLKQGEYLQTEVERFLKLLQVQNSAKWKLETTYHAGGYAKVSPQFRHWLTEFASQIPFPLEPVYSGKAFWGLMQILENQVFSQTEKKILFVHTGGIYPWNLS
ncbi:hypothetical protein COW36_22585 [bacterium (Candidatus Blackallbacteria) CG17_big_fil_post_rev_8_21_14_2_50_48_46]|uniref:Tryptophan synthase beta chain-like PALP domain-containing protein n=1 Tax=bacterium (Candidatus Blackallbacteria) CG17_big_fil_post_rev_8_21_14_2_50_48_46 TaxID=2014261 RepID=A0A2M7FYN4_9BACT|nr:MAG: hypothetical protein COW64_07355 [bacterium (Candidatus Blackallbacteria) CG18_big_fil_WC_8_21_14_2_50_49_26]PIW14167.1 MAG: hypothetical protein COW36_22585 [bacterium (Candidatus Blackallbacteria) CG17_big_fil_post_rev_8_21_14_2_50_48_46]PIW46708.1 MAG: hypothetical protein COW20_14860 [bacterium (Candidatus Blackallbacteria) CG13_big_fil_rev_8_21_14_2_50_49_14]